MQPIIKSFLDTDWYKITMGQVVNRQFPHAVVRYEFINRGKTQFPKGFADALRMQIDSLSHVVITPEEIAWLKRSVQYIKPTFLDWLGTYKYDPREVTVSQDGGALTLKIEGPWYRTVFWEVPLMAIISELYYKMMNINPDTNYEGSIVKKMERLHDAGVQWADFGTRRRFSYDVQEAVVRHMTGVPGFAGTSNPHLAMMFDTRPIGTYAHECVMAMQVLHGFSNCNRAWMDAWVKEYEGDLGIALPDTVTSEFFFRQQFSMFFAKLFDGVRQDSGDPDVFADRAVKHYRAMKVDPSSKRVVFSDGLNVDKAIALHERWKPYVRPQAGIGTHLTNDVGAKPMNMVIKMTYADFGWGMVPVVKLSDDEGKYLGHPARIVTAKTELGIM